MAPRDASRAIPGLSWWGISGQNRTRLLRQYTRNRCHNRCREDHAREFTHDGKKLLYQEERSAWVGREPAVETRDGVILNRSSVRNPGVRDQGYRTDPALQLAPLLQLPKHHRVRRGRCLPIGFACECRPPPFPLLAATCRNELARTRRPWPCKTFASPLPTRRARYKRLLPIQAMQ